MMLKEGPGLTNSDLIAGSSAAIALCAFFATAWQAWLAHHHNRVSVRPHLVWHTSRLNSDGSVQVAFILKNVGLGPAIVKDRYFTKNGERFKTEKGHSEVEEFARFAFGERLKHKVLRFGLPGKNAAIPCQEEMLIAELLLPDTPPGSFDLALEGQGKVDFHLTFESMYGEQYEFKANEGASRRLSWWERQKARFQRA